MNEKQAQQFASEWIEAWNNHDLDAILSHYADDVEFVSPFVVLLSGAKNGTELGKRNLRSYFEAGLNSYPDLKFELQNVLIGVGSVALYYRSVKNLMAAEVMVFDESGKVVKVMAHYA